MLLGLQVPDFTWPGSPATLGPTFRRIAQDADASGLASLWVMDHFFQIRGVGPPEHEMLEGWMMLAHAAAVTERVTLGTLVTGVTYRHPGLLVKTVDDARCPLRRTCLVRDRCGLERAGARGPRGALPAGAGAVRAAGGDAADRAPDVVR